MMCCNNCGWLRWVTTTNTTYYCEFDGQPLSDLKDCCQAWKSTIQTNADRISSMNNKELARVLEGTSYPWCNTPINCHHNNCYDCCEEWLKKEVKE